VSNRWIEICLSLIVLAVGLLLTAIVGLWGYMRATATPLHPNPQDLPSVTRSAPLPQWADAVERGQIVRAALTARNLPGISVAVGVGGDIVWAEGFGYAGDEASLSEHCERTVDGLQRFADRPLLFEPGTRYRDSSYLGWDLETVALAGEQTRVVGHDGELMGGMVASFMTLPEQGIVVAVTSNISFTDTFSLASTIAQAFAEQGRNHSRPAGGPVH
jgi:CubicO group peptidase (beta-lactamase class C family)